VITITQIGHALQINRNRDQLGALATIIPAKNSSQMNFKYKEHIRELAQTCADAAASIENVTGNALTAMSASKALEVWEKTGHTAGNIDLPGTVEWQSVNGTLTSATFTTDHTDTTTHVALDAAVTTARHIRSFDLTSADISTHALLLGNVAGTEIFASIPIGYHQLLKSGFMAQPSPAKTYIKSLQVDLNVITAVVTLVATFVPYGKTLSVTKQFTTQVASKSWEINLEIAAGTEVSWTIEDDNAAHPVAVVTISYVEAY
jgi:hypothetical protein